MTETAYTELELYDEHALSLQKGEDVVDRSIYDKIITSRKERLILDWLPKKKCLVLDYGCGNGEVSDLLATLNHDVVGLDLSKGMIQYAKKVTDSKKISYLVASGEFLPLRAGTFDAIIGIGVFHHVHLLKGLEECHRTLKPDGELEFMEPNTLNPFSFVGRKFMRTPIHTPQERTYTPWFLKHNVRKAGFDLINTKMMSFIGYSFGFLSAWLSKKGRSQHAFVLQRTVGLVILVDKLFETIPLIKSTCWIIAMNMRRR